MRQYSLRIGLTAVLCAMALRLASRDVPEALKSWLSQPNNAALLIYLETGRDVRFSASLDAFSPDFVESPPPMCPVPEAAALPVFSGQEEIDLSYAAKVSPDIPALLARPLQWDLYGEEPVVLILHTHSTESYTKTGETYEESALWRTLDENYNMLSIGDRVAQLLENAGIRVIHDRTLHDYPSYNGSYSHARKAISDTLSQYPSIRLILDLHRDASEGVSGQLRTRARVNGEASAQLMIVLGTNHASYEENLSLALKLHAQLERQSPGITRPLQLRAQRFNQDLSPGALLVEVGAAGNTHPEALTAAEVLAEALIALGKGTEISE